MRACECACRLTTMAYTPSQKDPACVGGRAEPSTSPKRSKWVPAVPCEVTQAEEATQENEHVNVNANLINSSCGGEGPSPVPAGLLLGAWSTGLDPQRPFPLYLSKSFPSWTQEPKGSTPRTDQLPIRKNTHQPDLQTRNNKCEKRSGGIARRQKVHAAYFVACY